MDCACGTVVGLHQALGLLLGAGLFNFAMDDARSGVGSRAADWEGGVGVAKMGDRKLPFKLLVISAKAHGKPRVWGSLRS